jgi:hypothetical protein
VPVVSAASIAIDGDGPTQHDDFLPGNPESWAAPLTGEASGFIRTRQELQFGNWLEIDGCANPYGDTTKGSLSIRAPLTGVGTTQQGRVLYVPTAPLDNPPYDLATSATVTVTQLGSGTVQGSFDVVVQAIPPSTITKRLTGTFDVCLLPDEAPIYPGMSLDGGP